MPFHYFMKKYLLLSIITLFVVQKTNATHTKGGWMYYEHLGQAISDPTKIRYRIGLKFYVECGTSVPESGWNFSLFDGKAPYVFIRDYAVSPGTTENISGCNLPGCYPCLNNIPNRCYRISTYETIIEVTPSADGYIISKQRCCRINFLSNLTAPSDQWGATYTIKIPGTATLPSGQNNSSPKFIFNDTAVVCAGNPFSISFTATDVDGDSLSYEFVSAFLGGDNSATNANPTTAAAPPYTTVGYLTPYSGLSPLGNAATINNITGIISGTAPPIGEYVVCVLVKEYRNGIYIAEARKEIHLKTTSCTPIIANPNPNFVTCDGFNVNFFHNSTGANNVFWDFGDPNSLADTSALDNPSYTYTDTGTYVLTFIINRNQPCSDTAYRIIKVYPGFFPGFITSPALCVNTPIQFTDTSYSQFAPVNSWRWNFGDQTTLADTSRIRNPTYTYPSAGIYTVELQVTNDKGCNKTYSKDIVINNNPLIDVFPADTLYCALDSIQLTGIGNGSFLWTPNTNIINSNTATPTVFPTVPTKYFATLTDALGCKSKDSVTVTPKNDLRNSIVANPPTICAEDTSQLIGNSNYNNVTWQWSPAATITVDTLKITNAFPLINTTYTLITKWGRNCVATATKLITVIPLAIPNAGPDKLICAGQFNTTQLTASGGNTYTWSPPTALSATNIANPFASPTVTTTYAVAVGVTGCAKTRTDSVTVIVSTPPTLASINDTLICNIDTLQLTTVGTGSFLWAPNYMISNTTTQSPFVSPDVPTKYFVRLTDAYGCTNTDTIFVDVKNKVTLFAGNDTTICKTDGFTLKTESDGLYYKWTPATYLNYDTIKQPYTTPLSTITYSVTANIGKCQSQDDVTITVVPYPLANARPDTAMCPELIGNVQLTATGGSNYLWTPNTFLTNQNIANPIAIKPNASIRYIVAVTDTLGCPKAVKDTIWVVVHPKVIADAGPPDTSVVLGQPLQLMATGGVNYLWTPNTWLNNPAVQKPISKPQNNIRYTVTATSVNGCTASDYIDVIVYRLAADMYVPNAFTPNGDGNNDVFRPILLGMKELRLFRVYNRFGQLLFETKQIGKGWDGTFKGRGQDPATYVWYAEAVSYTDEVKFKKGYVVLIRE
jgi:gliding motility-associated-like protein